MSRKIVIIGGGIIGLCTAYYLNRDGHDVVVIEKNDLNDGCSFGNMGYISPSHFVPLATPGIVTQGIKWMLNSSSPFYIRPRLNMDLIRWGMAFYRSANNSELQKNIPYLNNLLQLSRQLINQLQSEISPSFTLVEKGCWMLYKNQKTGDHEKHLAEQANAFGLKTLSCDAAGVQQYEPHAEVNVLGGILYFDDAYVDPVQLMKSLHLHLLSNGVSFELGTTVSGFELENDEIKAVITGDKKIAASEVIVANGSWLPQISKQLGLRMLLQPGKGYSFSYADMEKNISYPSILVDDRIATTPYDKVLRMGGTMELNGHNNTILPKRVLAIHAGFKKYYPGLQLPAPDPAKAWFGYRPVTPDGMPYIGRHKQFRNLSYAGGHAMLGVAAATGTGKLISEIINGIKPDIKINAFDPNRFG